jgi:hypothetical protein
MGIQERRLCDGATGLEAKRTFADARYRARTAAACVLSWHFQDTLAYLDVARGR